MKLKLLNEEDPFSSVSDSYGDLCEYCDTYEESEECSVCGGLMCQRCLDKLGSGFGDDPKLCPICTRRRLMGGQHET